MRIIAIIIPLMWGTVIFGHGKEKHEPKIIDDHKMDKTPQNLIPDEGERLNSLNDKGNNTKTTRPPTQHAPNKKYIVVQICAQAPKRVQMKILPFLPAYGKIWCFLHLHKQHFEICPYSKYIRTKLLKFVSCPFSPANQTPMNAPPRNKKTDNIRYGQPFYP